MTAEEVAGIIALRKKRDHLRLIRFKRSRSYKLMNIFNIVCFFIYLEIILCFFGPCIYETHYSTGITPNYRSVSAESDRVLSDIDVVTTTGATLNFVVRDETRVPPGKGPFLLGKDFLLRKKLKGLFDNGEISLRLFAASPVLIISALVIAVSFLAFFHNLNQNAYSLMALTVLNCLSILGILLF